MSSTAKKAAATSLISLLWTHALQELVVSVLEHLEDEFDVPRCRIESNPGGCSNFYTGYYTLQAHLSASWTRQAGKVRRYIRLFVAPGGVINTKPSITPPKELACPVEFYSTGVSDVEGRTCSQSGSEAQETSH